MLRVSFRTRAAAVAFVRPPLNVLTFPLDTRRGKRLKNKKYRQKKRRHYYARRAAAGPCRCIKLPFFFFFRGLRWHYTHTIRRRNRNKRLKSTLKRF